MERHRKDDQHPQKSGKDFQTLFESIQDEVTDAKQLNKLLQYFNATKKLTRELCRNMGLADRPEDSLQMMELGRIYRIRPEYRSSNLGFNALQCRAPFEIHRWMSNGSIEPWFHQLVSQISPTDGDAASGYLVREILSTGLTLSSLLNEFHPEGLSYSAAVERLARRFLVYEKAIRLPKKDRADRAEYFESQRAFMGIGGGPLPGTEELFN